MQSRGRMQIDRIRPGPAGPNYPNPPYSRSSHTQGHTSHSHRNPKPFYTPSRKYEILLEAGRLATEYLVSTGALPPNSQNFKGPNGNYPDQKGPNGNYPDPKGPNGNYPDPKGRNGNYPDPKGQIGNYQNAPRRFDDDFDRYRSRKNGRGKRQKGFYRKDSVEWERENKGRNSNSNSRNNSYSDGEEEQEQEEYLRYRRERKETSQNEVGSRVSGSRPVKREGKNESGSDLEDTGSKASSCSVKKEQLRETGEVSNGETGEVSMVEIDNSNNNVNYDNNNNGNNNNNVADVEPGLIDDGNDKGKTLLNYCEFAKVPTKPRSLANSSNANNRGQLADPDIDEEKGSDNPLENKGNQENKKNSFAQPIILEEEEEEEEGEEIEKGEIKKEEEMEASSDLDGASFKTCDLNLTGLGEITEIPDDPVSILEGENRENFGDFMSGDGTNNANDNADGICDDNNNGNNCNNEINESDNVVQVIQIEDDSPAQPKENNEEMVAYQNSENILTNIENVDVVMPPIQDGFNLTLSDYLGADMSCYPIQPDLQPVMHGVDDPIYGSLGDIGFMWDQPTQDYERFF